MSEDVMMYGKRYDTEKYDVEALVNADGVVEIVRFNGGLPYVDVRLMKGGYARGLAFPGGAIDPVTGYIHGDFIQPIKGQRVVVSFTMGRDTNAYISGIVFRAGYGHDGKLYTEFQSKHELEEGDVYRSHRSGAYTKLSSNLVENGLLDSESRPYHKIQTDTIESGFSGVQQDKGKIEQSPDEGISLGIGGPTGHSPVAVVQENMVLTAMGMQPILPATARAGIYEQRVKC